MSFIFSCFSQKTDKELEWELYNQKHDYLDLVKPLFGDGNGDTDNTNKHDDDDADKISFSPVWQVKRMLESKGDPNMWHHNFPLLYYVCKYYKDIPSHVKIIKLLLDAKADPNRADIDHGGSKNAIYHESNNTTSKYLHNRPLHVISTPEAIELLIKAKAKIDIYNDNHETPLMLSQSIEHAKILLHYKANPKKYSNIGPTSLIALAWLGPEIVKYLISYGVNARHILPTSESPLTYAGYGESIRLLIKHKAYLSPYCIFHLRDAEAVGVLVEANVDVNLDDNRGYTPLHYHLTEYSIAKALIDAKANVNPPLSKDGTSLSPLDLLFDPPRHKEVIEYVKKIKGYKVHQVPTIEYNRVHLNTMEALLEAKADPYSTFYRIIHNNDINKTLDHGKAIKLLIEYNMSSHINTKPARRSQPPLYSGTSSYIIKVLLQCDDIQVRNSTSTLPSALFAYVYAAAAKYSIRKESQEKCIELSVHGIIPLPDTLRDIELYNPLVSDNSNDSSTQKSSGKEDKGDNDNDTADDTDDHDDNEDPIYDISRSLHYLVQAKADIYATDTDQQTILHRLDHPYTIKAIIDTYRHTTQLTDKVSYIDKDDNTIICTEHQRINTLYNQYNQDISIMTVPPTINMSSMAYANMTSSRNGGNNIPPVYNLTKQPGKYTYLNPSSSSSSSESYVNDYDSNSNHDTVIFPFPWNHPVEIQNKQYQTPLYTSSYHKIYLLLSQYMANAHHLDHQNWTFFHYYLSVYDTLNICTYKDIIFDYIFDTLVPINYTVATRVQPYDMTSLCMYLSYPTILHIQRWHFTNMLYISKVYSFIQYGALPASYNIHKRPQCKAPVHNPTLISYYDFTTLSLPDSISTILCDAGLMQWEQTTVV